MERAEALRRLNTVYIISKGRPRCTTARTLERMGYPGEWFIVCGTNDESLPEYQEAWGEHVLVFHWSEEVERTDTMDSFGFERMASGACPVRNATRRISWERGELRHWQFDDDYNGFHRIDGEHRKMRSFEDGDEFQSWLLMLAEYGHSASLRNVGFPPGSETFPDHWGTFAHRVFNAHNLPSDPELFIPWVGRMNDDLINAINCWRTPGAYEMSLRCMNMTMAATQQEAGGLSELYKAEGTVRKTAYAVMAAPGAVRLVERFRRYHHKCDWRRLVPMVLNEKWRK